MTHAAVTALVAKIDGNPFSEWTSLMTQVVRAAMDCQGQLHFLCMNFILEDVLITLFAPSAFTAEQMSRLSDILEAALPQSTSSPISSRRSSATPDSMSSMRVAPLQSSRKGNTTVAPSSGSGNGAKSYGDLAKEFGVDTQIVEALIKRLSDFP